MLKKLSVIVMFGLNSSLGIACLALDEAGETISYCGLRWMRMVCSHMISGEKIPSKDEIVKVLTILGRPRLLADPLDDSYCYTTDQLYKDAQDRCKAWINEILKPDESGDSREVKNWRLQAARIILQFSQDFSSGHPLSSEDIEKIKKRLS